MNKKLKNIKVIVWDVDGTLYQSVPEDSLLAELAERKQINLLSRVKKIPLTAAKKLLKEKKKIYHSASKTLVALGCGTIFEVAQKIEVKGKARFIKKDLKLLKVFKSFKNFRHLALRNGTTRETIARLEALGLTGGGKLNLAAVNDHPYFCGLSFGPFEKVFGTVDSFGTVKPDPIIFKKILEYTKLPANQHLMVGDRIEVDLIPAKKLGMKTCLVWQANPPAKSKIVDIFIPTIHDLVKILK